MTLEYGLATTSWDDERWARAALSLLCEPTSSIARELNTTSAFELVLRKRTAESSRMVHDRDEIQRQLCQLSQPAGVVIPGDSGWPTQLNDLEHPPFALWWRGHGSLRELCARSVAVVGARRATTYGERVALRMGAELAASGWTVVSGGAFGIDAAAHRGALTEAPVVCVLASGVDVAYPVAHADLFERIASDGVLVSESGLGEPARRYRFLQRNRIIAALSRGTVVVEAAYRSGSLGTARRARELGRLVMGVPGPVTSSTSLGVLELLRTDPHNQLVTGAADVLELCADVGEALAPPRDGPRDARDQMTYLAQQVLDHLLDGPRSAASMASAMNCPQLAAVEALTELSVAGLARFDGLWRATPSGHNPAPR